MEGTMHSFMSIYDENNNISLDDDLINDIPGHSLSREEL
jgi:hypothetical protein